MPAGAALQAGAVQAVPVVTTSSAGYPTGGPHPGQFTADEITGGSTKGIDPQYAYDSLDLEVIDNLYENLITYNGSSGTTYQPVLAVCVPGPSGGQTIGTHNTGPSNCTSSRWGFTTSIPGYNGIFTNTGTVYTSACTLPSCWPEYYNFVIDPHAKFYIPLGSGGSLGGSQFSVYPTDIMFSDARDMAFANQPYSEATSGWILAQALLPNGQCSFDGGIHGCPGSYFGPMNNTPGNIMASMLINDTAFCPDAALVNDHGCITYVADGGGTTNGYGGSGAVWPGFLDYVDQEGTSVVSCAWMTSIGEYVPSFNGTALAGNGHCSVPGTSGGKSTGFTPTSLFPTAPSYQQSGAGYGSYLVTLNNTPYSWDGFENGSAVGYSVASPETPNFDPSSDFGTVATSTWGVGSGPYALYTGNNSLAAGYTLVQNPGYAQPIGCAGEPYGGTTFDCYPPAGGYVPTIYEHNVLGDFATDSACQAAYQSGAVDYCGFTTSDIFMLTNGLSAGYLQDIQFPTLSNFFVNYNFAWNKGNWISDDLGPAPNVPSNFLDSIAVRNFFSYSFPYSTAFSSIYQSAGVKFQVAAAGPIPYNLAGDYPTNVTYPGSPNTVTDTAVNPGSCTTSPSCWGYWWSNGRNIANTALYDSALAACTVSSPCTITLLGEIGATDLNSVLEDWATAIDGDTGGAIKVSFEALSFTTLLSLQTGTGNPELFGNLGWAPDYELPIDYLSPEVEASGLFPAGYDNVATELFVPAYMDASQTVGASTCGAENVSTSQTTLYESLVFWQKEAKTDAIPNNCQGIAYNIANLATENATELPLTASPSTDAVWLNLVTWVFNDIQLYVWQGQTDQLVIAAPWINLHCFNENPMFGGAAEQLWFNECYQTSGSVDFRETGLPANSVWAVQGPGFPARNNPANSAYVAPPGHPALGQYVNLTVPSGSDKFYPTVFAQAGPTTYVFQNASASVLPLTVGVNTVTHVLLTFAAADTATFTEHGLVNGTFSAPSFCVSLKSTLAGMGPQTYGNCTAAVGSSPASISIQNYTNNPNATDQIAPNACVGPPTCVQSHYTVTVTVPTGYGICTAALVTAHKYLCQTATIQAATYTLTVTGPVTPTVWFYQINVTASFTMVGLPSGLQWGVYLNSSMVPGPTNFSLQGTGPTGEPAISPTGEYTYGIDSVLVSYYVPYSEYNYSTYLVGPYLEPTAIFLGPVQTSTPLGFVNNYAFYSIQTGPGYASNNQLACEYFGAELTGMNGTPVDAAQSYIYCDVQGYYVFSTAFSPVSTSSTISFILLTGTKTTVYTYDVTTYTATTGWYPSYTGGAFASNVGHSVAITAVDPARHHVVLYAPLAMARRTQGPAREEL